MSETSENPVTDEDTEQADAAEETDEETAGSATE